MPVSAADSVTTTSHSGTGTAAATSVLGKDDFLKLLMAQLGAQDPLSPMDNQEFVAQLAQFASVEAQQAQSQRLDALLVAQAGGNQLQTANLVGKEAAWKLDTLEWKGGTDTLALSAQLSAPAANVIFQLKDAAGNVVRTQTVTGASAGRVDVSWPDGASLPPGKYTVSVVASDVSGKNIHVDPLKRALITGVSFESGFAELMLADGTKLKLSDVMQVNLPAV